MAAWLCWYGYKFSSWLWHNIGRTVLILLLSPLVLPVAMVPAHLAKKNHQHNTKSLDVHPPIPVHFKLTEPGFVTLVIENKNGIRVRNLIAETWFPAGDNTVWWDGCDDIGRDADAANHGIYTIPEHFVEPGEYRVRGLVRGPIDPHYEFTVYDNGTPPWDMPNHTGAWLGNHTPPQSALFVPAEQSPTCQPLVYLGCYITEGPDGLIWVDLDGKKIGGKMWIGGNWTAAPFLARDAGENTVSGINVYVASVGKSGRHPTGNDLRLTGITSNADQHILTYPLDTLQQQTAKVIDIGGIAVHNGMAVVSLTGADQLLVIDVKKGRILTKALLNNPRGVAFDANGKLLTISGNQLFRSNSIQPLQPKRLIAGLEDPYGLTFDDAGNIYISDRGNSNQVKVFTAKGKFIRAIGIAGPTKPGPYNPLHMNNPAGITIDAKHQLWVTEQDFLPKRVSVWSLAGKLINAFYGPAKYGGGGKLDEHDKTLFYYAENEGSMQFKLDWQTGTSKLTNVFYRPGPTDIPLAFRSGSPETSLYHNGQRYFTNCYNSSPTGGHSTAFLFIDRDGIAQPAAAMGSAELWDTLKTDAFKYRWPEGVNLNKPGSHAFFIWSDLNGDGHIQPEEVTLRKATANGVTIMPDLSFCIAMVDDKAMHFAPVSFNERGIPVYSFDKGQTLMNGVLPPTSSGGDQVLVAPDGWSVVTLGVKPFNNLSLSGSKNGVPMWSYPDLWPGLHASHNSPIPDRQGQLVGTTRLLGGLLENKASSAGPLWAINGNHGSVYLFTSDGLFVATLFTDMRQGKLWNMPVAHRDMTLDSLSLGQENFWPSVTQTPDGSVYLIDGTHCSIIRLDGLKSIRRLNDAPLNVSKIDLEKSRGYLLKNETERQHVKTTAPLSVKLLDVPTVVDGQLDDWKDAEWVDIDKRGVKAYFNSNIKPYNVTGAVSVSGDRLYVAYQTGDFQLQNSGEMPIAPFKTGSALDVMIGTDPKANPDRQKPATGDLRLLVTLVKGKPLALIYREVVPDTKEQDKIPFSSPSRTITFDQVDDVSSQIQFAQDKGNYEISIPLNVLGLKPVAGVTLQGDIGILRGISGNTTARIYWNNKATGITADAPSEAELTPSLWGKWIFKVPKK